MCVNILNCMFITLCLYLVGNYYYVYELMFYLCFGFIIKLLILKPLIIKTYS